MWRVWRDVPARGAVLERSVEQKSCTNMISVYICGISVYIIVDVSYHRACIVPYFIISDMQGVPAAKGLGFGPGGVTVMVSNYMFFSCDDVKKNVKARGSPQQEDESR